MLQQPGSLHVPKTGGRSRFSKALPAIPGVDTNVMEPVPQLSSSTSTTPASATAATITPDRLKYLQDLPPPPPPPHNDCKKTPIQFTPLPPLPTPKTPAAATPAAASPQTPKTPALGVAKKPSLTISRKPVGSGKQMAPKVPEKTQGQPGGEPQSAPPPQQQQQQQQQRQQLHKLEQPTQPQQPKQASQLEGKPLLTPQSQLQPPQQQLRSQPQPQEQPQHQSQPPAQSRTQDSASANAAASAAVHVPVDLPPPQLPPKSGLRMDKELPSQPELKQEIEQPQLNENQRSNHQDSKHDHLSPSEPSQDSALPHFPQPPSPSESLSSIFSAYTRSSNGSDFGNDLRSSDGAFSVGVRESQQTEDSHFSPHQSSQVPPPPPAKRDEEDEVITPQPTATSFTTTTSTVATAILTKPHTGPEEKPLPTPKVDDSGPSSPLPPPPPAKDEPAKPAPAQASATSRPVTPPKPQPPAKSDLTTPSPSRPQIWRRRSLNGSRELPNLKLNYSHGSTAATQAASHSRRASATQQATKPAELEGPVDTKKMGSGSSRLRQLKEKLHISRKSEDGFAGESKDDTPVINAPPAYRPPTPEYRKEDVKTPMVDTFVSPVSPATSPEMAQDDRPVSVLPLPEQKPITRKAVPAPMPNLQPAKSLPNLKNQPPGPPPAEPMPPMPISVPSGRASPTPNSPYHRGRWSEDTTRGAPSRSSSAHPDNRRPYDAPRFYSRPEEDPLMVQAPNGQWCYRGRDGTLYPDMKELPEPDTRAMNFPAPSGQTLTEDAVIAMKPLRDSHFECYQKHKNMYNTPNRRHVLCCQTCEKDEPGKRWYCHFCYLRLCDSCMNTFNANGRDLRALMNHVGNTATLSLSSNERPGAALGLQMVA
ncbi:hypothetical protein N3K66_002731 [Trichothecium roseum]|uniref:Uncharacterized protein n=1 Tax=Trichothecium roseum TaxID=47278 RepID=A0ACC0VAP3_9HYPO|nr:hypothetical protein N3K66_002731 [Trichothecium roseum]